MIWATLLFAWFLRMISLNQSLWLDEATTALVSKMSLVDIFTKFLPGDFHPPLYYLLMKGWISIFGSSEIALRIPSVIFGVGIIYLVYLIGRKLLDKKTALIASILAATSGLLIYYSQEARMYGMTAFLTALAFYLFIENKWMLFSLSIALLGMTDYVSLLVLPVFLIFSRGKLKKLVISLIPLVVVFIIWAPIFIKQIGGGLETEGSGWWNILGILSWKNLVLIPIKFVLGRIDFQNNIVYGLFSGFSFLTYFGLSSFAFAKNTSNSTKRHLRMLVGWLLIPIFFGIIISIKIPILHYFRFLFCLPALYMLVANGISGLSEKKSQLTFGIVLILNIFFSGKYLLDNRFHRENWRDMSLILGSDKIVFPASSQKEALTYYNKGGNIIYYKDFSGGEPQIWLSRYVWDIFDPNDEAKTKIEALGYNKVQEIGLNGVEFWKYQK